MDKLNNLKDKEGETWQFSQSAGGWNTYACPSGSTLTVQVSLGCTTDVICGEGRTHQVPGGNWWACAPGQSAEVHCPAACVGTCSGDVTTDL